MRIGLIARSEIARGIAIQSRNFFDNMPVERVLLVRMPRPDCPERPEWYGDRYTDADYDPRHHRLDEELVRTWLDGLDVVFTVETPNDWRIPEWCREMGVKLVIQGNPEFVRHGLPGWEHLPHPDEWWWPTGWRLDNLPAGRVMPVPMNRRPARHHDDARLHVVHIIGKRAFADRNGTDVIVQAARMIRRNIRLTVHSIDGGVSEFSRNRAIEMDLRLDPVDDPWSMYDEQDVLVIPRRYGGLCLPALEASAAGLVVMMPDTSPNEELAAVRIPGSVRRRANLSCGPTPLFDTNATALANTIDRLSVEFSRRRLAAERAAQAALLPTWDIWRPRYLAAFEALL